MHDDRVEGGEGGEAEERVDDVRRQIWNLFRIIAVTLCNKLSWGSEVPCDEIRCGEDVLDSFIILKV